MGNLGKIQGRERERKREEKDICQAENPKGQSRQKLGPKKKKKVKSQQIENLKM